MKKLLSALGILLLAAAVGSGILFRIEKAGAAYSVPDPCNGSTAAKQTKAFSSSSAGTTSVLAAVGSETINVCSTMIYATGASPTVGFEYGTQVSTACDTGTTALTGVITGPATATPATPLYKAGTEGSQSVLVVPGGNGLCIVTTGSTEGITGYVTYIQG